ncbi:type II secretion system protein GspK [Yersinia artesiana]|uniref:type II secretion system protein GspK n=1 Tax=Yersinia artesiana TaxID=2890315 RepID=UPI001582526C|nr:type II secretion system protein GspK [Yersinia artesiana]
MKQRGIALLLVLPSVLLMSTMLSTSYLYLSEMLFFIGDSRKKQDEKQLLLGSEYVFLNEISKDILIDGGFSGVYFRLLSSPGTIRVNNKDVHYSLIDRTNCLNVNALYNYFINMNKNNEYYPWLVLKNILHLNNITSSVLNEIMMVFVQDRSDAFNSNRIDRGFLAIQRTLQIGDSIDKLLNISSENFSHIAPLLCSRNDNTLLINVDMLDFNKVKLMQAIFMNEITENEMHKTILSKPAQGWGTVESFFEFLEKNSGVGIDRINELKKVDMLKFSHNEYYFSSNFKIEKGDLQLMSLFQVRRGVITVLQRRFIL